MTQANKSFLIVCTFLSLALCIQSDLNAAKRKKPASSSSSSAAKRSRPIMVNNSEAAREALLKYWTWSPEEICELTAEFLPTPEEARCREAFNQFLRGDIIPNENLELLSNLPIKTYTILKRVQIQTETGKYIVVPGRNLLYSTGPVTTPGLLHRLSSDDIDQLISRLEQDRELYSRHTDTRFYYNHEITVWKLAHTLALIWEADTPAKRAALSPQFCDNPYHPDDIRCGLSIGKIKIAGQKGNLILRFRCNKNQESVNSIFLCHPEEGPAILFLTFSLTSDIDLLRRLQALIKTTPGNKYLAQ